MGPSILTEGMQLSLFPMVAPPHRLPTNTTTRKHPFHRWFNFIAGFSPEFASQCIRDADLPQDARVLDPFAGCGTTLVQANSEGFASTGYEAHIFFAAISRAKTCAGLDPDVARGIVEDLALAAGEGIDAAYGTHALAFLSKLFPAGALPTLLGARRRVESYDGMQRVLGYLLLSRVLDYCSHSKTDGVYKAPTSAKRAWEFGDALQHVGRMLVEDLSCAIATGIANKAEVHHQSSVEMAGIPSGSHHLMVTSPPYLNNFDYAEMTRMYLYFWGHAENWQQITDRVRSKLVVNTTTAVNGHRDKSSRYRASLPPSLWPTLDAYQAALSDIKHERRGKKDYDLLVYPYFYQMGRVLRNAFTALVPGAPVHIIVSDAALYGVHIRTQDVIAEMLREYGFRDPDVVKLRSRGSRWVLAKREGAQDGLGEFHITARR